MDSGGIGMQGHGVASNADHRSSGKQCKMVSPTGKKRSSQSFGDLKENHQGTDDWRRKLKS